MRARREHRLGQLFARGEVEVGEQDLAFADQAVLGCERLLDLDDHLGLPVDLGRRVDDLRADGRVLLVLDPRAEAAATLDQHGVAGFDELHHHRRDGADAVLLGFDLCGYADDHG